MLKHGCIRHGLVKIGSNRVGSMTSNYNTAHATLLQGFCDLPEEFLNRVVIWVNNYDLTNVLFSEGIDRLNKNEVFFTACGCRVRA